MKNPIPYKVKQENEKFFRTTQFAYFFGLSHLGGYFIFQFLGVPEMAWFNALVSSPAFILALILNRLGKHNIAFAIAFFELFMHQVLGTYFLGWNCGLQFLLIYLAGLSFFNPHWKRGVHVFILTLISSAFLLLFFFCQEGVYSIPEDMPPLMYPFAGVVTIIVLAILINGYSSSSHRAEELLKKANVELEEAHNQTRSLLLNILPESIADRLSGGERQIADTIEHASILFSDLVGFTKFSSDKTAKEIVTMLNDLFYRFDTIVEAMNLEKIKTIGDGYMVAAGIPKERSDHATAIVECAFKMFEAVKEYNIELGTELDLRIGISSGPVVAGVIGKNKFTYDLWGDPVNTASRMESHGLPGKIHISDVTFEEIKDSYSTEHRGEMEIKGKGRMNTYFVESSSQT